MSSARTSLFCLPYATTLGRWFTCLCLGLCIGLLQGCAAPASPSYQPQRGQMGKDVMWLPTSPELVHQMMKVAQVGPQDLVVDLGAGDGIIPIMAARDYGARSIGIEYNAKLADFAQRNVQQAGLSDRVRIIQGDLFQEDFSQATVVTMYLLPEINLQLRPTLLQMKPGTRLVSHDFDMADWEPDQTIELPRERAFLWIVPAQVAGRWSLRDAQGQLLGRFTLTQRFQNIGGHMHLQGNPQVLLGARLRAGELRFQYVGKDDGLHSVRMVLDNGQFNGEMTVHGQTQTVIARQD
jgi:hypothetical protein